MLAIDQNVVINEVAWMGGSTSANDEWIELANNTDEPVDLSGWRVVAEDGSPNIQLSGNILARGYAVLERTDDQSVLDVKAFVVYTGALENKGEKLSLVDSRGMIIDEVDGSAGRSGSDEPSGSKRWLAGDSKTRQTMERSGDSWRTSLNAGGTPGKQNSEPTKSIQSAKKPDFLGKSGFMVGTPFLPSHFAIALSLAALCSLLILVLKNRIADPASNSSDALGD